MPWLRPPAQCLGDTGHDARPAPRPRVHMDWGTRGSGDDPLLVAAALVSPPREQTGVSLQALLVLLALAKGSAHLRYSSKQSQV